MVGESKSVPEQRVASVRVVPGAWDSKQNILQLGEGGTGNSRGSDNGDREGSGRGNDPGDHRGGERMPRDYGCEKPVCIVCGYTDLRQGIDGLAKVITDEFELDPFQEALFLFCGRRRDRTSGSRSSWGLRRRGSTALLPRRQRKG